MDDDHFVLNTHGLHNAHLLRKVMPRTLTEPKPLYEDRKMHHFELARRLRAEQGDKRKATQAKRKATLEANKAKKAAKQKEIESAQNQGSGMTEADETEDDDGDGSDQRKRKRLT